MKPKATIIIGHGINCDRELEAAFNFAGAEASRVHLDYLLSGRETIEGTHIVGIPGGFSFGDDCGGGNIFAKLIMHNPRLRQAFIRHLERGGLVFGPCNGNQIGSYMNLIPVDGEYFSSPEVAYSFNDSARYEDRGNIHLRVVSGVSHWLKGLDGEVFRNIPVGHGEGNFKTDPETLQKLYEKGYVALKYVHEDGTPANGRYPVNPNGSIDDIAGLASEQVLLLMPHPERAITPYNEHGWTKRDRILRRMGRSLPAQGEGMKIIVTGVEYCRTNLI
ncbi:phosphoribosylformylglycinamidine synthase subunit PurQ [Candidatus Woesearchaeota archaeon]|nr:phosphoribosylformylglycinamidine synthase subunit PurQ [Candidatus Woesearchaeota archaeon]